MHTIKIISCRFQLRYILKRLKLHIKIKVPCKKFFKVDNLTNNKLQPPFAIINTSKKYGISLTITDWVRAKQLLLRP